MVGSRKTAAQVIRGRSDADMLMSRLDNSMECQGEIDVVAIGPRGLEEAVRGAVRHNLSVVDIDERGNDTYVLHIVNRFGKKCRE